MNVALRLLMRAKAGGIALTGFLQAASDAANLTTYTFASQNVGAADPARIIVVAAAGFSGSARTISSVTIGGVTATAIYSPPSAAQTLGMYYAAVPSGTTASVVVTFSGSCVAAAIAMWAVVGTLGSVTPTTTASGTGVSTNVATTVTGVTGGFIIHAFASSASVAGATATWTNATERYDVNVESGNILFSGADATTVGSVTTTATASSINGAKRIISAVFAP